MASFDVIFIGGGPAGYVGAIRAAQLGLDRRRSSSAKGWAAPACCGDASRRKSLLESALAGQQGAPRGRARHHDRRGEVRLRPGDEALARGEPAELQGRRVPLQEEQDHLDQGRRARSLTSPRRSRSRPRTGRARPTRRKKAVVISTGSRVRGLPQAGPRAQQDDRALVRRSAGPREGTQDDADRRRRRGRLRVRRCLQRVRDAGHAHRHRAGDPAARRRRRLGGARARRSRSGRSTS